MYGRFWVITDRGIHLWDKVLLCCSESSLASWWVDNEIGSTFVKEQQFMKERGKKGARANPIEPRKVTCSSGTTERPSRYSHGLLPILFGWERDNATFEQQVEHVIRALRADEGARENPPQPKL